MPVTTAREAAAAIVAHLDAITNVDGFLSQGPTPPRGRVVVVHPDGGAHRGPLGDPDRDLRVEFQTTCIGETAEQALWTHDQVSAALWRAVIPAAAGATLPVWMVDGSQQPVMRDDDLAQPLFYVTCAWIGHVQPS